MLSSRPSTSKTNDLTSEILEYSSDSSSFDELDSDYVETSSTKISSGTTKLLFSLKFAIAREFLTGQLRQFRQQFYKTLESLQAQMFHKSLINLKLEELD